MIHLRRSSRWYTYDEVRDDTLTTKFEMINLRLFHRSCRTGACRTCRWAAGCTRSSRCSSPPPASSHTTRMRGEPGSLSCRGPAKTDKHTHTISKISVMSGTCQNKHTHTISKLSVMSGTCQNKHSHTISKILVMSGTCQNKHTHTISKISVMSGTCQNKQTHPHH